MKLANAGKKVVRTVLKPEQAIAIAQRLEEPYATLVLFHGRDWTQDRRSDRNQVVTLDVYDDPEIENFRAPLESVANQLLRDLMNSGATGK